jgi:hypothetical protein
LFDIVTLHHSLIPFLRMRVKKLLLLGWACKQFSLPCDNLDHASNHTIPVVTRKETAPPSEPSWLMNQSVCVWRVERARMGVIR